MAQDANVQASITTLSGINTDTRTDTNPIMSVRRVLNAVVQYLQNQATTIGADQLNLTRVALAYSASITPNALAGRAQKITVTNTTAFTINAPTNPLAGRRLSFEILNSSGGIMGAITWDPSFLLAGAFTNPASTKRRLIEFEYDGTNWIEQSRTAADG